MSDYYPKEYNFEVELLITIVQISLQSKRLVNIKFVLTTIPVNL